MSEKTSLLVTVLTSPPKTVKLIINGSQYALETNPTAAAAATLTGEQMDAIEVTQDTIDTLNSFQISVVESTTAGRHSSVSSLYPLILKPLFAVLGIEHSYLQTTSASSIQEYASATNLSQASSPKLLYLFLSGDTTIFEFVNFLHPHVLQLSNHADVTILPFPHGTGNALCNSLKLFDDLESIKALFRVNRRHLPLYQLHSETKLVAKNPYLSAISEENSIFFLVVASWCLHSTLVFESDKPEMRSKYGSERFRVAALKILEKNPVFRASITYRPSNRSLFYNAETKSWSTIAQNNAISKRTVDLSYFLLAAVPNFEKTFMISPDSVVTNDQLHLLTIPHIPSNDMMALMNDAYNLGKHIKDRRVFYSPLEQSSSLELDISDDIEPSLSTICLDGSSWEVTGKDRKLTFTCVHQSFLYFLS